MRPTERVRFRVSPRDGGIASGTLAHEVSRAANSNHTNGTVWSAFLEHARSCDADAYQDLYLRLKSFRRCFTRCIFADPEGAYREFVRDLVDEVRYGFLADPGSLLAQARANAVRKTSDRVHCLTMAARVLCTVPKRHREVLIRAQLALHSSAQLLRDNQGGWAWSAGAIAGPPVGTERISSTPRKPIGSATSHGSYGPPAAVA